MSDNAPTPADFAAPGGWTAPGQEPSVERGESRGLVGVGGATPVCSEVLVWLDAHTMTKQDRKTFIEHFEGWPAEKQMKMASDIERRKLQELCLGMEDALKETWLEKALSWIGL